VENWQSELQLEWQCQLSDLVTVLVWSPNGRGWAASSAAGEVIWNSGRTDPVELQAADGQSIDSLAFSADSRWLAAAGQAGELLIWNCDNPDLPPQLFSKINLGKWIEHLAWQPINSQLAITYGSQVQIWDIPESREIFTCTFGGGAARQADSVGTSLAKQPERRAAIFDLAWHPDGKHLAMSGSKGVQIWADPDSQTPTQWIEVDTASISIAWAKTGRYLAIGNFDRTLTIVDWQNLEDRWTLTGCPGKIRQIVWIESSPTPSFAVASGTAILVWSLTADATSWNGQLLEGHQDTVTALAAHPRAPILGSVSLDGYACCWSTQGEIQQIITDLVSKFTTLAWQPQHEYLVTGSQTGSIKLWHDPSINTDEVLEKI
jgi:WD40 repeat protein